MARHRRRSPGGSNVLRHPPGRQKLLLQRDKVSRQPVPQGLQAAAEGSIIEEEARYVLKYPQSLPEAVEVSIDKAQH